jgi:hypothetical protein
MNSMEISRILNNSALIHHPPDIRAAFQNGLVYGLVFCDWFAPGFLAHWSPRGTVEEKLVGHAQSEAALNQKRGYPLIFCLENMIADWGV